MKLNRKPRCKMVVNTSLSIITLNVVELNTPIKRHRVEAQIKEQKQNRNLPYPVCKRTTSGQRIESKGMGKDNLCEQK